MLTQISTWMKDFTSQNTAIAEDDEIECEHIRHMLVTQLDISVEDTEAMLDESIASHDDRIEIHSLTRHIRNDTDAADRAVILEMIWMVVLADGSLDAHESQLMRRLAGLLFVDDVESGFAAKRARRRLGLAG